ncbi:MAG: dual specificity protein phosphatase family protein [Verrucomicrobiota bacterium]|jgi:protein tyrosine/serine phosphatase
MRNTILLFLLGLTVGLCACAARQGGVPPGNSAANFGVVNERLYRGAQPDVSGLRNLKRLGVGSIINLRMTNDAWKAEAVEARANGMAYTNVPLSGIGRPTEPQVREILGLIESLPPPVFIHCKHGRNRTGTIVACYRIEHDQWSSQAALAEARRYGMSRLARGMRRLVIGFEKDHAETENRAVSKHGSPR